MDNNNQIDSGLSICLDVLRFGAALLVFVGHAASGYVTGGFLWQLQFARRPAVMVFFVLSGYVIAATLRPQLTDW